MTYNDGFNRTVSEWLIDQVGRGSPDYLDEILAKTTRTRQRPAWSSLERWLPMESTTRFAPVPRFAWLLVIIGLILALSATAVLVGSRIRDPLPPPFGMTGNGIVIYSATDGDIYALDTETNRSSPLVAAPGDDRDPSLSPDGSKLVFNRQDSGSSLTNIMVSNADGSDVRALTESMAGSVRSVWSPDSQRLAVAGTIRGIKGLWIVGLDDQASLALQAQDLTPFAALSEPLWRPNGQDLVFLGSTLDQVTRIGIYLIRADGTGLRTIVEPGVQGPGRVALSPDGTRVAYSLTGSNRGQLHIVDLQTGNDVAIAFQGTPADVGPRWSPDGSRLLFERYNDDGTYHLAVGSVDGGPVVEIGLAQPANTGGSQARFSTDGTKVLAFYNVDGSTWILDPADGSQFQLSDEIASPLSWQGATP